MTTTLVEQIEEMRIRMHEQSRCEQDLVNTLGSALKRADETLLQAVRSIALEHELRREYIMKELQALANRLGTLPVSQLPAGSLQGTRLKLGNQEAGRPIRPLGVWGQEASALPGAVSTRS